MRITGVAFPDMLRTDLYTVEASLRPSERKRIYAENRCQLVMDHSNVIRGVDLIKSVATACTASPRTMKRPLGE